MHRDQALKAQARFVQERSFARSCMNVINVIEAPNSAVNVTNNQNTFSAQGEQKMYQVDSFCHVSSVVATLSTLPDAG